MDEAAKLKLENVYQKVQLVFGRTYGIIEVLY